MCAGEAPDEKLKINELGPKMYEKISLVPRLPFPFPAPPRKVRNEPGRFVHLPHDVACVVLCMVLIIDSLLTQSGSKY